MDARRFHQRLFTAARRLIPPNAGVVVGVSGGPDSMALLHGLVEVNRLRRLGWKCVVAHLDHRLRPNSADDRRFVEQAARALNVPCETAIEPVADLAARSRIGLEEAGRHARYRFFADVAARHGAAVVAVGHHADDHAETILHRAIRGTGLRGLAGVPRRRRLRPDLDVRLVRPLLDFERRDILAYLRHRGIQWRDDESNADPRNATRNRVRREVLPFLESSLNPKAGRALRRLAAQARSAHRLLSRLARQQLGTLPDAASTSRLVLPIERFAAAPVELHGEMIRHVLRALGVGLQRIGHERLRAVVRLARPDRPDRAVELKGVVVRRAGGLLHFEPRRTRPVSPARRRHPVGR